MVMSGAAVLRGEQTIGDFVLINALLMQLSIPLNFIGFVYREIKQGLIDIEAMFDLLDVAPEIVDKPDAKPLVVDGGTVRFDDVIFALRPGAADPQGHQLRGAGRARRSPSSARPAPASRPSRGCSSASTTSPAGRSRSTARTSAT